MIDALIFYLLEFRHHSISFPIYFLLSNKIRLSFILWIIISIQYMAHMKCTKMIKSKLKKKMSKNALLTFLFQYLSSHVNIIFQQGHSRFSESEWLWEYMEISFQHVSFTIFMSCSSSNTKVQLKNYLIPWLNSIRLFSLHFNLLTSPCNQKETSWSNSWALCFLISFCRLQSLKPSSYGFVHTAILVNWLTTAFTSLKQYSRFYLCLH